MQVDVGIVSENIQGVSDVSHIATGGQKSVFKCMHDTHGDVVIKVIGNPNKDQRIRREIDIVIANNFSNVPHIYEFIYKDINSREFLFIIEQFISGENLRYFLQKFGVFNVTDAVSILRQLLSIVVELEDHHLVHRDIKPENIIMDKNDNLWLLDFGIARHLDMTSITATQEHFGPHTLGYAAPEQYRNVKSEINSRADLFSIGVVFYEIVTGINPYISTAQSPLDVIRRIEQVQIPKLDPSVIKSQQLSDFICILMAKYPSRRPQNARQALSWFNEIYRTIEL